MRSTKMKQPEKKDVYLTIIVLVLACFAISYIFHLPKMQNAGIGLLLLSLVFYKGAEWITVGWLKFAEIVGGVNSKILLSIVFFIFLVPISFVFRLFNKDILHLKKTNSKADSNYITRNHKFVKKDLENIW